MYDKPKKDIKNYELYESNEFQIVNFAAEAANLYECF